MDDGLEGWMEGDRETVPTRMCCLLSTCLMEQLLSCCRLPFLQMTHFRRVRSVRGTLPVGTIVTNMSGSLFIKSDVTNIICTYRLLQFSQTSVTKNVTNISNKECHKYQKQRTKNVTNISNTECHKYQ